jgi:hypothetical protein
MEIAIPVSVAFPVFWRLMICGELAMPTAWLAKVIDAADNETAGPTAVPERETGVVPCDDCIERVPLSGPGDKV